MRAVGPAAPAVANPRSRHPSSRRAGRSAPTERGPPGAELPARRTRPLLAGVLPVVRDERASARGGAARASDRQSALAPAAQPPRRAARSYRARAARRGNPGAQLTLRCVTAAGRHRRGRRKSPSRDTPSDAHASQQNRSDLARLPSATRAGFPHDAPVPALLPLSTTNTVVGNGARPTLCDVDASRRRSGPVDMWKTCVA